MGPVLMESPQVIGGSLHVPAVARFRADVAIGQNGGPDPSNLEILRVHATSRRGNLGY